ncbi:hypothetical protein CONLIGDRAFT_673720 [Coniochaeta ligniaria NRRL 30616]|uniref:Uncharacterized protein n=1 Tax=Coniochaeta ligniaria NRRL 30616 TaxID=1408157 RepID=A0A1J7IAU3_9PEZI|nr:hypothetical protein CONLIGDRAFT_673720 [Coniochaeta ligniaria NRRL 30616]
MSTNNERTIDKLPQWRLLGRVCPLFEYDLAWTPCTKLPIDKVVVSETAALLKVNIQALKYIVPAGQDLAKLPGHEADDFVSKINSLLDALETLLDDDIKYAEPPQISLTGEFFPTDILGRFPKLVALVGQLKSCGDTSMGDLCRFVLLEQDALSFVVANYEVQAFSKAVGLYSGSQLEGTRPRSTAYTSQISESFRAHSLRIYESLVTHLEPCTRRGSSHEAMLQLKHTEHRGEPTDSPGLYMLLASCPQGDHWQEAHCRISSEVPDDSDEEDDDQITDICESVQFARHNNYIFRIQVAEQSLRDRSDGRVQLEYPSAAPTVSLLHLMKIGMLKDRYGIFPNDKKILAYTLAHALLNLHDSCWLQKLWTPDNLFFPYVADTDKLYNIHQPYVACTLSTDTPPLGTLDAKATQFPLIFSFAKLLMELDLGEQVHAEKLDKKGKPSLWITVRDYYEGLGKHQLSHRYRNALEACLNFRKYVVAETKRNPERDHSETVQQAILKYIVQELEADIDITRQNEWGKRVVDLKSRTTVGLQAADVQVLRKPKQIDSRGPTGSGLGDAGAGRVGYLSTQAVLGTSATSRRTQRTVGGLMHIEEQHRFPAESNRKSPRGKVAGQTNAQLTTGGVNTYSKEPPSRLGHLSSRSSLPSPPALSRPPRLSGTQVARGKAPRLTADLSTSGRKPGPVAPGHREPPDSIISATTRKTTSDDSVGPDSRQESDDAWKPAPGNYEKTESGFGSMQLFSASDASGRISYRTFTYINKLVDRYWQHWDTDTPIKIAVLDTGFDFSHADFRQARTKTFTGPYGDISCPAEHEDAQADRVKGCRNFCPDQPPENVCDIDGHGTQVAGIILRLAPHAHLYIARVCAGDANRGLASDEKKPEERQDYLRPQPKYVQEAIQWALSVEDGKGVDIINMSLGFRNLAERHAAGLRDALAEAQKRGVVVFAATSNDGVHEPVAWPASDRRYAIGVHSCGDRSSQPSEYSAMRLPRSGDNFLVLGENILSQWPTAKGGGFRVASGTSFAAPVASAIGALVLQFVWQKKCKKHNKIVGERAPLADLCTNGGMSKVLAQISTKVGDGFLFIDPKLFWGDFLPDRDDMQAMQHAWDVIEKGLRS